ncbi:MAG: hypothetical protein D6706_01470, partial [Chloroflexi bacterium]
MFGLLDETVGEMTQMSHMDSQEELDHIKRLIKNKSRRLHKLKEQKALKGSTADPAVELEIEDLEKEIEELRAKQRDIEKKQLLERSYQIGSEQESLQAIARILKAEMPSTSGKVVSLEFTRKLQYCATARYLNREVVALLVGDSRFLGRLKETPFLVNFEDRFRIRRDVRSRLTDRLYRVNEKKYIELHQKLRNHYRRKLNRQENYWRCLIEGLYHEWCQLANDQILKRALNEAIELFGEPDQNSFEDIAWILMDIADEHKDRQT